MRGNALIRQEAHKTSGAIEFSGVGPSVDLHEKMAPEQGVRIWRVSSDHSKDMTDQNQSANPECGTIAMPSSVFLSASEPRDMKPTISEYQWVVPSES